MRGFSLIYHNVSIKGDPLMWGRPLSIHEWIEIHPPLHLLKCKGVSLSAESDKATRLDCAAF